MVIFFFFIKKRSLYFIVNKKTHGFQSVENIKKKKNSKLIENKFSFRYRSFHSSRYQNDFTALQSTVTNISVNLVIKLRLSFFSPESDTRVFTTYFFLSSSAGTRYYYNTTCEILMSSARRYGNAVVIHPRNTVSDPAAVGRYSAIYRDTARSYSELFPRKGRKTFVSGR